MSRARPPLAALVSAQAVAAVLGLGLAAGVARAAVDSGLGVAAGGGLIAGEESYKTDLFTGAATVGVPLLLPAGANGFQPSLALRYSSQRGITWVGRGWDLAIPAVERMTKFGTPSYLDDPQNGDHYQLGDDRLVRDDAGAYRRMRDDFARIERVESGGPPAQCPITGWIVRETNGVTQWFGSTPDSRSVDPSTGCTFRWLLSRSEDPNGNYIRYEYATPAETGDDASAYPKRITYSFAGDESPGSATLRSVDFTLGTRTDPTLIYTGGFRREQTKRLESVAVKMGGQLVTRYDLVYWDESYVDSSKEINDSAAAPPNRASLLRRVVRIGADGSSTLASDKYVYAGWQGSIWQLPSWTRDDLASTRLALLNIPIFGSFDLRPSALNLWRLLDVNGDGAPDILGGIPDSDWATYLNDKTSAIFPASAIPENLDVYNFHVPIPFQGVLWNDVNGDGKPEIINGIHDIDSPTHANYTNFLEVFLNDGLGWGLAIAQDAHDTFPADAYPLRVKAACYGGNGWIRGRTILADVNGDGLADLVSHYAPDNISCSAVGTRSNWTQREVYLNNGSGWSTTPNAAWGAALDSALTTLGAYVNELLLFDANGDGLVDLARDDDGNGRIDNAGTIDVLINTGRGWLSANTALGNSFNWSGVRPIDIDGDGLADSAVSQGEQSAGPQLGTGTAFVDGGFTFPSPFNTLNIDGGETVTDLDGDGLVDLVRADGSFDFDVYRADRSEPADLLIRVERGSGAAIQVSYRPSTAGDCYPDDAGGRKTDGGCNADAFVFSISNASSLCASFPFVYEPTSGKCFFPGETLPFVVQTVGSVSTDDLNGNVRTDTMRYDGGRYSASEREFRGFGAVTERPQAPAPYANPNGSGTTQLGVLRITRFYQKDYLRGVPGRSVLASSIDGDFEEQDDAILDDTVYRYAMTRGDLDQSLLLRTDLVAAPVSCDPLDDPPRPECPFLDLAQDPYGSMLSLPAPLPYTAFRDEFCLAGGPNPSNRDCAFAYLVLPVGSYARRYDGGSTTDLQSFRWHDLHGNVQAEWAMNDVADPSDDRISVSEFAAPAQGAVSTNLFGLPKRSFQQDPNGAILASTTIDYDSLPNGQVLRANVTATRAQLDDPVNGIAGASVLSARSYPSPNRGLPDQVSDPQAPGDPLRQTAFGYDAAAAFVATSTRTLSQNTALTTITHYDPPDAPPGLGIVHRTIDANNATLTFTADRFGRPTSRSGPDPIGTAARSVVYNDFIGMSAAAPRQTVTVKDGNGNDVTTSLFSDGLDRLIRTKTSGLDGNDAAADLVAVTTYDVLGRVSFQSRSGLGSASASGATTFYDARGRPRFVVQPDAGVQELVYQGLQTSTYDAEGRRTDLRRDGAGSVLEVSEHPVLGNATAETTRYVYDFLGRLRLVCLAAAASCGSAPGAGGLAVASDPRHTTLLDYDSLGRRVRIKDPDLGDWRYRFDGSGNLLERTDARGQRVAYSYDAIGRLAAEDRAANGTNDVVLTYGDALAQPPLNSRGRLYRSAEPEAAFQYAYDGAGRMTSTVTSFLEGGGLHTVSYTYDWQDRVTSTTYPDGEVVTRQYDKMGVDRVFSGARSYVGDVRHDAEGHPTRLDYGNGTLREMTYQTSSGYLASLVGRAASGGAAFLSRGYGYDKTARITGLADSVEGPESLSAITYDGVGRIATATRGGQGLSWSYDALGNLALKEGTAQSFTHPTKPHALVDPNDILRFVYDPNGNLWFRESVLYSYDAANRMVAIATTPLPTSFAYERGGERIRRQHGADVSRFLGPDYEIQNGLRFVKTIRVEGAVVAQVSVGPGPSGAAAPAAVRLRLDPRHGAAALATLLLAAMAAGLLARPGRRAPAAPAWQRALASGLPVLLVLAPALPALAAAPGDVREDQQLDAADVLLVHQAMRGEITLTPTQQGAADVAPFAGGEAVGDGQVTAGDLAVLLRAVRGDDVDEDGLDGKAELLLGFSPLSRDSNGNGIPDGDEDPDQDGLSNAEELALGTDPSHPDSDGDGIVDGQDGEPLVQAGTQVVFVHADHLGGSAVLTDTSGQVVRRISYGVFGEIRQNARLGPAATLDPAEKYTGQRFDPETGLAYYGARYYDAGTGRFTQPDVVVPEPFAPQSFNRYAYVNNDPLNLVDPSGNGSLHVNDYSFFSYSEGEDQYGNVHRSGHVESHRSSSPVVHGDPPTPRPGGPVDARPGDPGTGGSQIVFTKQSYEFSNTSQGERPAAFFGQPEFLPVTPAAVTCGPRPCDFSGNPSGFAIVSLGLIPPAARAARLLGGVAAEAASIQGQFALGATLSAVRTTTARVAVGAELALTAPPLIAAVRVSFRLGQGVVSGVSRGTVSPLTAPTGRFERAAFRAGEFVGEFGADLRDRLGNF